MHTAEEQMPRPDGSTMAASEQSKERERRITVGTLIREGMRIWQGVSEANLSTYASSSAYFFFTSLIPVIIVLACVVSRSGVTEQQLIALIAAIVPDVFEEFVADVVGEAYSNAGLALTASIVALLWTASRGIAALTLGLNAAYGVKEDRSFIKSSIVSFIAVIELIALLAAAVYLIFGDEVARLLSLITPLVSQPDVLTTLVRALIIATAGIFIFASFYTYLPAGRRRFRAQLPGAALTGVAWFIFSFGFRIYVENSTRFTLFYGSLTMVAMFLVWMYGIFLILLAGGLFNRFMEIKRQEAGSR